MLNRLIKIAPLYFLLFSGLNTYAAVKTQPFIVNVQWLADHLKDDGLIIFQIGNEKEYKKEHIPGAQFLSIAEISTAQGDSLALQIPPVKTLITNFEKHGVSNSSRIILYYGNDWVTPTARVYLTLDYLGLSDNTSILDGGFPEWKKEGLPVTNKIPDVKKGTINPEVNNSIIVNKDWVNSQLNNPSYQIVDARTEDFYSGTNDGEGEYIRPGHIPGASNIPFVSLTTDDTPYLFKDKSVLENIYTDAGVNSQKTVVAYCHIGQQASLVYFIAKYLGYNAKLYDGSYQEWDKTNLPVIGPVKIK